MSPKTARSLSHWAAAAAFLAAISGATQASGLVLAGQAVVLLVCFVVLLRWFERLHLFVCGFSVFVALVAPSVLVPLVVGLIVVAAGLQLIADRGQDVEWKQLRPTAIVSLTACALVMALAGATIGPFAPNGGGSGSAGAGPTLQPETAPDTGNALSRFLGRIASTVAECLGMTGGEGGTGEGGLTPRGVQPPEPEREINWIRLFLAAAVLGLVCFALWWLWKRWRNRPVELDGSGNWAVRSFDATGQRVARPRRVAEDPASYGGDIDATGDGRLSAAGHLVSAHVYRPPGAAAPTAEARELRRTLQELDDLPSAPRPPRRRPERRQIVVALVLLAFAAFAVHSIWRGPFWMDEGPTASMLTAPASGADGYRWVLCAVDAVGDGSVETFESRGFVDRDASLVAIESFGNGFGRTFVAVDDSPVSSVYWGAADRNGWVYWPHESDPATAASVDMRELRSMNGVVAALGLEDAVTEGPVARDAELYQAWERPNQTQADGGLLSFGDASVDFNRFLAASAHRVEVWADGDGMVEHLRVSLQEFGETAIELRFVDSVPDIEPPELGGRTRLNLFGDCPAPDVAEPDTVWLGFETYDATVSTIANIAVDGQGRAYEHAWRADGEHGSESLGVVQLDLGALFLLRASSIGEEEPTSRQVDVGAGGPVDITVSRVAFDDSKWTSALRFDLVGGEVDVWERLGDHDCVYYSPVAIGSSSDGEWPGLGEEALSTWPDSVVVMADGKPWPGLEASEASCLQLFVGKADDEVQAVLLAFDGVAFRTVAPDGTPPDDVQAAQRRLQACVDGEVEIEEFGRCRQ